MSKIGGRKPCSLTDAARHNRREIQAELGSGFRIDPARSRRNETIVGPATAAGVVALADQVASQAGIDLKAMRRDHCQAVELVFSVAADAGIDDGGYFRDCLQWAERVFPGVAVLAADIHRDESAPHAHILLSPIKGGKFVGSALIGRVELAKLRESFWQEVAGPAGFRRSGGKLCGASKEAARMAVVKRLELLQAPELRGPLWNITAKQIAADPLPYLIALGIDPQTIKVGTPSKRPKPIGIDTINSA